MSPPTRLSSRVYDALGIALLLTVLAILGVRQSHLITIPGQPERSRELGRNGLADFADVIYYPLQAIREGVNPYDCSLEPKPDGSLRYRQRYPVHNLFPLYSPLLFLLYWPFAFADFTTSAVLYVIVNVVLLLALSGVIWRCAGVPPSVGRVTTLASVILATQAGRANFLGGETAIPLALASIGAVTLAPQHPWLAGLALAITSFKPTFGLPLGILLLAGQHYRTVAVGWGLGLAIGLAGLALVFANSGDLSRAVEIITENQRTLDSNPEVDAQQAASRVDSAGTLQRLSHGQHPISKVLSSLVVFAIAAIGLWHVGANRQPTPQTSVMTMSIVCLATVSSMYHLTYDAILLWAPLICLLFAPTAFWQGATSRWRWCAGGLLLVPMLNVLPTATVQSWIADAFPALTTVSPPWPEIGWVLACTVNGVSLLVALALLAWQSSHAVKLAAKT